MNTTNLTDVTDALDILLEELEKVIKGNKQCANGASDGSNYRQAKEYLDGAESLESFWREARKLQCDIKDFVRGKRRNRSRQKPRASISRLPRGCRTSEKQFFAPILESLDEMGGSGAARDVLGRVYNKVEPILKEADHQPVPSDSNTPRWRKSAQFARNELVQKGFLNHESPHGTWEITDIGRQELQRMQKTQA
jgi:hypothetical protein